MVRRWSWISPGRRPSKSMSGFARSTRTSSLSGALGLAVGRWVASGGPSVRTAFSSVAASLRSPVGALSRFYGTSVASLGVGNHLMPTRTRGANSMDVDMGYASAATPSRMVPGPGFPGYYFIQHGLHFAWVKMAPIISEEIGAVVKAATVAAERTFAEHVVTEGQDKFSALRMRGIKTVWNGIPAGLADTRIKVTNIIINGMTETAALGRRVAITELRVKQKTWPGDRNYRWGKGHNPPIGLKDISVVYSTPKMFSLDYKATGKESPDIIEIRMGPNTPKARAQEYGLVGRRVTLAGTRR